MKKDTARISEKKMKLYNIKKKEGKNKNIMCNERCLIIPGLVTAWFKFLSDKEVGFIDLELRESDQHLKQKTKAHVTCLCCMDVRTADHNNHIDIFVLQNGGEGASSNCRCEGKYDDIWYTRTALVYMIPEKI